MKTAWQILKKHFPVSLVDDEIIDRIIFAMKEYADEQKEQHILDFIAWENVNVPAKIRVHLKPSERVKSYLKTNK